MWDIRTADIPSVIVFVWNLDHSHDQRVWGHRNATYFLWLLLSILLLSMIEAVFAIVQAVDLPNSQLLGTLLLYIVICVQINFCLNSDDAWQRRTFRVIWAIIALDTAALDLLCIAKIANTSELVGIIAKTLRCCLELTLFAVYYWPSKSRLTQLGQDVQAETYAANEIAQANVEIRGTGWFSLLAKSFRILLPWLRELRPMWPRAACGILLRLIEHCLDLYFLRATGEFADKILQAVCKESDRGTLNLFLGFMLAHFGILITHMQRILFQKFQHYLRMVAQKRFFEVFINRDATFHGAHSTEELTRAMRDSSTICRMFTETLLRAILQIVHLFSGGAGVFYFYGVEVAFLLCTALILRLLISLCLRYRNAATAKKIRAADLEAGRRCYEALKNVRTVASYGKEDDEVCGYHASLTTTTELEWQKGSTSHLASIGSQVVDKLCTFTTSIVFARRKRKTEVTAGDIIVFNGCCDALLVPLTGLLAVAGLLAEELNATCLLRRLLEFEPAMEYGDRVPVLSRTNDHQPASVEIELTDVTLERGGKRIFDGLNVTIPFGKMTAIVGQSGVGKTCLVDLITRKIDPQKGSIKIGGLNIKELSRNMIPKYFTVAEQTPVLFSRSIEENVKYGNSHASYDQMRCAAKQADADDFIMDLPTKYGTVVGNNGRKLSKGQEHRISLARAILAESEVKIFDEPTSALDVKTERHIMQSIQETETSIIITHRLQTIVNADQIIVLEKAKDGSAKIAEKGSHPMLLEKGGYYAKLWEMSISS